MLKQTIFLIYYQDDVFKKTLDVEIKANFTITDVMNKLGLPTTPLYIFFLNSKLANANSNLKHGDVVKIIPALAGG